MLIEVFTDASMRTFPNGRTFGCSGAISPQINSSIYSIIPDCTNNQAELTAIYLGCRMINDYRDKYDKDNQNAYYLYSDSQFSIKGLTEWLPGWVKSADSNGIYYGSNNKPVKNQNLFNMIAAFVISNNLSIRFRHQAGHINYRNYNMLQKANKKFYTSNGYFLSPDSIYRICYFNDLVDKNTRNKLQEVDDADFPIVKLPNNGGVNMVRYVIPSNISDYMNIK